MTILIYPLPHGRCESKVLKKNGKYKVTFGKYCCKSPQGHNNAPERSLRHLPVITIVNIKQVSYISQVSISIAFNILVFAGCNFSYLHTRTFKIWKIPIKMFLTMFFDILNKWWKRKETVATFKDISNAVRLSNITWCGLKGWRLVSTPAKSCRFV